MPRKSKTHCFYSLLLLLICVATSFSSVKGWCFDNENESVDTHVLLADCHSNSSVWEDTTLLDVEMTHSTDNKRCTTCYDLTSNIVAAKLFDDSLESLVSAPPTNNIFSPQQYSEYFSATLPLDAEEKYQSFFPQTQQYKSFRTTVLLI